MNDKQYTRQHFISQGALLAVGIVAFSCTAFAPFPGEPYANRAMGTAGVLLAFGVFLVLLTDRLERLQTPDATRRDPRITGAARIFTTLAAVATIPIGAVAFSISAQEPWHENALNRLQSNEIPSYALSLIAIATVAILEELVFRRILPRVISTLAPRVPSAVCVLAANVTFAAVHLPDGAVVGLYHLLFGLLMSAIYSRVQSFWLPVSIHAAYNILVLMVLEPAHSMVQYYAVLVAVSAVWMFVGIGIRPRNAAPASPLLTRWNDVSDANNEQHIKRPRIARLDRVRGVAVTLVVLENTLVFRWSNWEWQVALANYFHKVAGGFGITLFVGAIGVSLALREVRSSRLVSPGLTRLGVINGIFFFPFDILFSLGLIGRTVRRTRQLASKPVIVTFAILLAGCYGLINAAARRSASFGADTVPALWATPNDFAVAAVANVASIILLLVPYCAIAFLGYHFAKRALVRPSSVPNGASLVVGYALLATAVALGLVSATPIDSLPLDILREVTVISLALTLAVSSVRPGWSQSSRSPLSGLLVTLGRRTLTTYLTNCALIVSIGPLVATADSIPLTAIPLALVGCSMAIAFAFDRVQLLTKYAPENWIR